MSPKRDGAASGRRWSLAMARRFNYHRHRFHLRRGSRGARCLDVGPADSGKRETTIDFRPKPGHRFLVLAHRGLPTTARMVLGDRTSNENSANLISGGSGNSGRLLGRSRLLQRSRRRLVGRPRDHPSHRLGRSGKATSPHTLHLGRGRFPRSQADLSDM